MRRRRELHELPARTCRWGERCLVCLWPIEVGERYRDGGHGRRAHMECAEDVAAGRRREPAPVEVRELEEAERDVSRAKGAQYVAQDDPSIQAAASALLAAGTRVRELKQRWAQPDCPKSGNPL